MILERKLMDFLIPGTKDLVNYSHKTKSEEIANKILDEGFEFIDSFQKTTDSVTNDPVYLQYWHNLRERYGDFTIVISISKKVLDLYISELNKIKNNQVAVEQILTELEPWEDDNDEEVYTLPPQFIKGYFNNKTGKIVKNNKYDPYYDSPSFIKNIHKLNK